MEAVDTPTPSSSLPQHTEAVFSEFRALRAEHDVRVGKQQEITQFALGLTGVVVALFGALLTDGGDIADARGLFPVFSLLLSALLLMVLDHEMNIAHIQIYIHQMAARERSPWRWVKERAALQQHPGRSRAPLTVGLASAKYWTTFIPNFALLIMFVATSPGHDNPWYGWLSFGIAAAVAAFALAACAYTSKLYVRMPHDATPCDESTSG